MKVLITGAAGQLGSELLTRAPTGVEVVALSHRQLDLTDERALWTAIEELRPSLVINAAAYTAVDRAESEPEQALLVNAEAPATLAEAVARIDGARLLHVSTDYVFSGDSSQPYLPDDATGPLGVYGRTKLAGERAVLQQLGQRAVVLRSSWLYGPRGHNFLQTMLRLMRERGAVRVVSDQIGNPTCTASVARLLWALAARPDVGGVLHWSDAGVASWYDFAAAIAEDAAARGLIQAHVSVTPITTAEYPTPARRPRYSVLDTHATQAALGLQPLHWRRELQNVLDEMSHA